jgi:putative hydrolase of the HAD superfamily
MDLVVVDADDTLWEDRSVFRSLYREAASIFGKVNGELLRTAIERCGPGEQGFVEALRSCADGCGVEAGRRKLLEAAIERFQHHAVLLLDGVTDALAVLSTRARIVLYTKGVPEEQMRKVRESGLQPYFERIYIVLEKNAPELCRILADCECDAARALVVGNSIRDDIVPAHEIGARCIWLNHSGNRYGRDAEKPAGVPEVRSWGELGELVGL